MRMAVFFAIVGSITVTSNLIAGGIGGNKTAEDRAVALVQREPSAIRSALTKGKFEVKTVTNNSYNAPIVFMYKRKLTQELELKKADGNIFTSLENVKRIEFSKKDVSGDTLSLKVTETDGDIKEGEVDSSKLALILKTGEQDTDFVTISSANLKSVSRVQ